MDLAGATVLCRTFGTWDQLLVHDAVSCVLESERALARSRTLAMQCSGRASRPSLVIPAMPCNTQP